jgi:hypothetical protein
MNKPKVRQLKTVDDEACFSVVHLGVTKMVTVAGACVSFDKKLLAKEYAYQINKVVKFIERIVAA